MPETTLWFDVCSNANLNRSLCSVFPSRDCGDLRLLDIVVTRNFFVLATSFGLIRSACFAVLTSQTIVAEVKFNLQTNVSISLGERIIIPQGFYFFAFQVYFEVSSPVTVKSHFANGDVKLQYTPYCLDFHVYSEGNDVIYLLTTGSTKALYKSVSPHSQLVEMSISNLPFKSADVLGIVNDVTKRSEVLLIKIAIDQVCTH